MHLHDSGSRDTGDTERTFEKDIMITYSCATSVSRFKIITANLNPNTNIIYTQASIEGSLCFFSYFILSTWYNRTLYGT